MKSHTSRGPVVAIIAITALIFAGGITLATWKTTSSLHGGTISSGDLRITTGQPSWRQVTPGVVEPSAGSLESLGTFRAMPGDVIEVDQPITTTLIGENLQAGITASFGREGSLASGDSDGPYRATWHVEDRAGQVVAPEDHDAELGNVVRVPGLDGTTEGVTARWTVVITIRSVGDYTWASGVASDDPEAWEPGDLRIELSQLRGGRAGTVGGALS